MYGANHPKHSERLVFQVSGKLWQRSLVMRDLQTGSLWSHILGECMDGPSKGTKLQSIPSVITTWGDWKKEHPATTVLNLDLSANRFGLQSWQKRGRFVLGIEVGGKTQAWPYNYLQNNPVIIETLGGTELLIAFKKESATAFAFETGGAIRSGKMVDGILLGDDGTKWDLWKALAIDGPQKGKTLTRVYALPSFRKAWLEFHPESEVAGEPKRN